MQSLDFVPSVYKVVKIIKVPKLRKSLNELSSNFAHVQTF